MWAGNSKKKKLGFSSYEHYLALHQQALFNARVPQSLVYMFHYLLEKEQLISPNLGVNIEQRLAKSSTMPVIRLIKIGTP